MSPFLHTTKGSHQQLTEAQHEAEKANKAPDCHFPRHLSIILQITFRPHDHEWDRVCIPRGGNMMVPVARILAAGPATFLAAVQKRPFGWLVGVIPSAASRNECGSLPRCAGRAHLIDFRKVVNRKWRGRWKALDTEYLLSQILHLAHGRGLCETEH